MRQPRKTLLRLVRRLLVAFVIVLGVFAGADAGAASVCTAFLSAGQPVPPWIAPGVVLCLHGGDYPHSAILPLTTNSATYMSVPGEHARIVGVGLTLYGHDVVLSHLEIDNGGISGPDIPAIALKGDRETLDTLVIHNGHYNGVEVRGQGELLIGNTISNFNAGQADAECVTVFKTASHLKILNNTIHDCSGNGIELYTLDGVADTQVSTDVLIDGNTIKRGGLPHSETLIGVKDGSYITITHNSLSGTQDYNWAMGARGWVDHLMMADNTLTGNWTGIELGLFDNGGVPRDVLVTRNLVDNTGGLHGLNTESGGGFNLNINGCVRCAVTGNTFAAAGNYSVFVDGALGWESGTLTNNLIVGGVTPRLWPGSALGSGVTVSHNGWWGMSAGFLGRADDVLGDGSPFASGSYNLISGSRAAGLGAYPAVPLPTATATLLAPPTPTAPATASALPSQTPTAAATATTAPSSTPMPSATPAGTPLGLCYLNEHVITCY